MPCQVTSISSSRKYSRPLSNSSQLQCFYLCSAFKNLCFSWQRCFSNVPGCVAQTPRPDWNNRWEIEGIPSPLPLLCLIHSFPRELSPGGQLPPVYNVTILVCTIMDPFTARL